MTIPTPRDEAVEAMARVIYESTEAILRPNFWDGWTLTDFAKADARTRNVHHVMARAVLSTAPAPAGGVDAVLLSAAKEFLVATQERINASFVEAAYDPTDWRRTERDLLSAIEIASLSPAATSGSEAGGDASITSEMVEAGRKAIADERARVGMQYPDTLAVLAYRAMSALAKPSSPAGGWDADFRPDLGAMNGGREPSLRSIIKAYYGAHFTTAEAKRLTECYLAALAQTEGHSSALSPSTSAAEPVEKVIDYYTANCCHCGRIIDTREEKEGGDKFGCELSDGRWTCSPECWGAVTEPATPPAPAAVESAQGVKEACAQIADARAHEAIESGWNRAKSRTGRDKANAAARMAQTIAADIRASLATEKEG